MPRLLKLSQGGPGYTPVLDSVHCPVRFFYVLRPNGICSTVTEQNQQLQLHLTTRRFALFIFIIYHAWPWQGKGQGQGKGRHSRAQLTHRPCAEPYTCRSRRNAESPAERALKQRKLGNSLRKQLSVKYRTDFSVRNSEDAAAAVAISSFSERAALADVDVRVSDIAASGVDVDLICRATTGEDVRAHSFRY